MDKEEKKHYSFDFKSDLSKQWTFSNLVAVRHVYISIRSYCIPPRWLLVSSVALLEVEYLTGWLYHCCDMTRAGHESIILGLFKRWQNNFSDSPPWPFRFSSSAWNLRSKREDFSHSIVVHYCRPRSRTKYHGRRCDLCVGSLSDISSLYIYGEWF